MKTKARYFDSDSVRKKARRLFGRGALQSAYLAQDDSLFPLKIGLKKITEKTIRNDFERVRREAKAFEASGLPCLLRTYRFAAIGEQRLPEAVVFENRETYLEVLGLKDAFADFQHQSAVVLDAFEALREVFVRKPLLVAEYAGAWERLVAVCRFLFAHPRPGIYLRQLPIEGVDTKFVEAHRKVLDLLLTHLLPEQAYDASITVLSNGGFERKYGFRTPPLQVRFRILDAACEIAGQSDMTLTAEGFATLSLEVDTLFIVENKATFLAFPPRRRSMVVFGGGYGFAPLRPAAWMALKRIIYWGDLDSHGFAILSQLRSVFPQAESLMMDHETAERFAHLAVEEPEGKTFFGELTGLKQKERALFEELRKRRFRLEQERIPYDYVQRKLEELL
jgi:hypothetical protein